MKVVVEKEGTQYEYTFPATAYEMSYAVYIDIKKAEEAYFKANQDQDDLGASNRMIEVVALGVSGDLTVLPFELEGDDLSHFESIESPLAGISIVRLYKHLVDIVNDFDAKVDITEPLEITYKGDEYQISQQAVVKWMVSGISTKGFTIGEIVEAAAIDHYMTSAIKKDGDPEGSIEYERELRVMAVLLRKPGEELPSFKVARMKFVEERAIYFQDMMMSDVLRVRFFLSSIYEKLRQVLTSEVYSEAIKRIRGKDMTQILSEALSKKETQSTN